MWIIRWTKIQESVKKGKYFRTKEVALCAKCCGLFKFNEQVMDLAGAPGELIWSHSSGLVGERAAAYYGGRENGFVCLDGFYLYVDGNKPV